MTFSVLLEESTEYELKKHSHWHVRKILQKMFVQIQESLYVY